MELLDKVLCDLLYDFATKLDLGNKQDIIKFLKAASRICALLYDVSEFRKLIFDLSMRCEGYQASHLLDILMNTCFAIEDKSMERVPEYVKEHVTLFLQMIDMESSKDPVRKVKSSVLDSLRN